MSTIVIGFKKLMYGIILIADKQPTLIEKLTYAFHVILAFSPIAFLLNGFGLWFGNNHKFCQSVVIVLLFNMIIGACYHYKMKTFSWELFFKRNSLMIAVVIVVYILLEQLRLTAGENFAGDAFKVLIQIATLLWPISKALKNIYILTNKQHPPSFIMTRLYNFEKTGDVKALLKTEEDPYTYPSGNTENTENYE